MEELIVLGTWAAGAVIVVGVIEWMKGLFKKWTIPTKVWSVFLPVVSLGASWASCNMSGDFSPLYWNAAGVWGVSQLAYTLIVQSVKKKFGGK